LDMFEKVGHGFCMVTADCRGPQNSCLSDSFQRVTSDPTHRSINTETCAAEALQFGAQGFSVRYNSCALHPKQDPGMTPTDVCPFTSTCPAPSPYGSYSSYDWWWSPEAGVGPILGFYHRISPQYRCYRLKDIDVCATGADDCHADATCTNNIGGFDCACNVGYSGDGKTCAVCCQENTAECLSCFIGVTEEEFCDASPCILGCFEKPVCCEALTAECLSCQLGLTVEEFCMSSPLTPGCTPVVDPCLEYSHKGSCGKQRNCIWKKADKKCMTG